MATGNVVASTLIEPVRIRYRGHGAALYELTSSATTNATTPNGGLDGTEGNIPTNRPLGVLSSQVAALATVSGKTWGCRLCTEALEPLGIFLNCYTGNNMENSPGVASNKVTVLRGQPSLEVPIFETRNDADTADLSYTLGDKLYSSDNSLLSNEESTGGTVIGVVTHVNSATEDWLGVDMRI